MPANRALILALAALVATSHVALAAHPAEPLGPEFQANSYTTNEQDNTAIALDSDGDFVVVWESYGQDAGDGYPGVFGQRYASNGSKRGGEFQVNSYTTGYQFRPAVGIDSDGDFVVVWASQHQDGDNYGIFGQRYASDGSTRGGEFQVSTYTTNSQSNPRVGADDDGDFVVVWTGGGQDGDGQGVFGQRYDSSGAIRGGEFQVSTYITNSQGSPRVVADDDGDFVVVWRSVGAGASGQDGDGAGIFGQRYASDGSKRGGEFQANSYTTNSQDGPAAAMDSDGDFVVVWGDASGQDGASDGAFGQRYASNGSKRGGEFQINTYTLSSQNRLGVAADADGDFVVVWQSYQDGDGAGVFGQRYDSDGSKRGAEFAINTYTTNYQTVPGVAADIDGNFVVVWQSYGQDGDLRGVFGQRYGDAVTFADGFESGDTTAWSSAVGGI